MLWTEQADSEILAILRIGAKGVRMDHIYKQGEKVVKPIVDDLKKTHPPAQVEPIPKPPVPAEQDQDAGGGYNPDHTNPQT